MRLHVEALFTCDEAGRLIAVNERRGAPAPRVFVGRTVEGARAWCRNDLDPALVEELTALADSLAPGLPSEAELDVIVPFAAVLERSTPVERTFAGPAFACPTKIEVAADTTPVTPRNANVLERWLDEWLEDVAEGLPFEAVLEEGHAVSLCCSVRVTPDAHEAGVETRPEFRGRGHALEAVAGWAAAVHDLGRLPLYSTSWDNHASRAVARKLGLVQFGADFHLT